MQTNRKNLVGRTGLVFALVLAVLGLNLTPARAAGTCFVNSTAGGANDGTSWADAYTEVQSALANAGCSEVWVAAGTYTPTSGNDRTATFQLLNGVALYGGFAGTETARDQRNPAANDTILSGDIGTPGDKSDNSYHVVTGSGTNSSAVLDGFTATAGNANGDFPVNAGAGGCTPAAAAQP